MPPTRRHSRFYSQNSLQNRSLQAHISSLSSETHVHNTIRASSPQSIHSTVHMQPANFTHPSTSLVIYFHIESYLLSRLILCNIFRSIRLLLPYLECLRPLNPTMATLWAQG